MITEEQARKAAFWNQRICLDCGAVEETSDAEADEGCENCGGGNVFQGALVVTVLDAVERE